MSFTARPIDMWAAIGVPTTKAPINVATFVSYVLPPTLLYLVMAVLAVTPQTRTLRVAFWPVVALLALRAAFSVDMAPSDSEQKFHNDLAVSDSFGQSFSKPMKRKTYTRLIPEPDADDRYPLPLLGISKRAARETTPSRE